MNLLKNIDTILSQKAGDFNILTTGVDYVTVQVKSTPGKRALQAATYGTRLFDCAVQVAVSPIFALYQTGKLVYTTFIGRGLAEAILLGLSSPLVFIWKVVENVLTAKIVPTAINTVIPYKTGLDIYNLDRHVARLQIMNNLYPFMLKDTLKEIEAENLEGYINSVMNEYGQLQPFYLT